MLLFKMNELKDISEFTWILIFAFLFPLLFILMPRKQMVPLSASMPAVIAFVFIWMILSTMIVLSTFFWDINDDITFIVTILIGILVSAGIAYLFVKHFMLAEALKDIEEAVKEENLKAYSANKGSTAHTILFVLSPLMVILIGATITRLYGKLLFVYPPTILIALIAAFTAHKLCRKGMDVSGTLEMGLPFLLSRLIPFSIIYFILIVILSNSDMELIKNLF